MAQYTPCGDLSPFPELQRAITRREQEKVEDALFDLELEGFTQSRAARGKFIGLELICPAGHSF